jgi:hypothetical protein
MAGPIDIKHSGLESKLTHKEAKVYCSLDFSEHEDAARHQQLVMESLADIIANGGDSEITPDYWESQRLRINARKAKKTLEIKLNVTQKHEPIVINPQPAEIKSPSVQAKTQQQKIQPEQNKVDRKYEPIVINHKQEKTAPANNQKNLPEPQEPSFLYDLFIRSSFRFWLLGRFTSIRLALSRLNRVLAFFDSDVKNNVTITKLGGTNSVLTFLGLSYFLEFFFDFLIVMKHVFIPSPGEEHLSMGQRFVNALNKDGRKARMWNAGIWFTINLICLFITGGTSVIINIAALIFDVAHEAYKAYRDLNEHYKVLEKVNREIDDVTQALTEKVPALFNNYNYLTQEKNIITKRLVEIELLLKKPSSRNHLAIINEKETLTTQLATVNSKLNTCIDTIDHSPANAAFREFQRLEFIRSKLLKRIDAVRDAGGFSIRTAIGIIVGFTTIVFPQAFLILAGLGLLGASATYDKWDTKTKVLFGLGIAATVLAFCFPPSALALTAVSVLGAIIMLTTGSVYGGFGNWVRNSWLGKKCGNVWDSCRAACKNTWQRIAGKTIQPTATLAAIPNNTSTTIARLAMKQPDSVHTNTQATAETISATAARATESLSVTLAPAVVDELSPLASSATQQPSASKTNAEPPVERTSVMPPVREAPISTESKSAAVEASVAAESKPAAAQALPPLRLPPITALMTSNSQPNLSSLMKTVTTPSSPSSNTAFGKGTSPTEVKTPESSSFNRPISRDDSDSSLKSRCEKSASFFNTRSKSLSSAASKHNSFSPLNSTVQQHKQPQPLAR